MIIAIASLLMVRVASAGTFVESAAGTYTVYDATTGGVDAGKGPFDTIAIFNDSGSAAAISVQIEDYDGTTRYVTGREAALPAGQGAGFTWNDHKIAKIKIITTGAATIYVCPIK
jgi:hypothetical protein